MKTNFAIYIDAENFRIRFKKYHKDLLILKYKNQIKSKNLELSDSRISDALEDARYLECQLHTRELDLIKYIEKVCNKILDYKPKKILNPKKFKRKELGTIRINFYTSLFPIEINESKHNQDNYYYINLESKGIKVKKGKFSYDENKFDELKVDNKKDYLPDVGKFINLTEKGVDVKMAVDLVTEAHKDINEIAVVFSEDSDQAPTIEFLRTIQHKKIIIFGFTLINEFSRLATYYYKHDIDDILNCMEKPEKFQNDKFLQKLMNIETTGISMVNYDLSDLKSKFKK